MLRFELFNCLCDGFMHYELLIVFTSTFHVSQTKSYQSLCL